MGDASGTLKSCAKNIPTISPPYTGSSNLNSECLPYDHGETEINQDSNRLWNIIHNIPS